MEKSEMYCYACAQLATSREHVPPRCIFPKKKDLPDGDDLRKQLITVPSCDAHNLQKSGDDEYLMYVLAMTLPANTVGLNHFSTKVVRAIRENPALIQKLLNGSQPIVLEDPDGELFDSHAVQIDGARLETSFNSIALGLYLHEFGIAWGGDLRVQADFLVYIDPQSEERNAEIQALAAAADELFRNIPQRGENPEVFFYQVKDAKPLADTLLRMTFYRGTCVTAFFGMH
jgi:hypothetical protein